jgi:hypothetical protein
MHDLDITRFVSDAGANSNRHLGSSIGTSDPFHPVEELTGAAKEYANEETLKSTLSPAEAIEHMRDVARLLHNFKHGSGRRERRSN